MDNPSTSFLHSIYTGMQQTILKPRAFVLKKKLQQGKLHIHGCFSSDNLIQHENRIKEKLSQHFLSWLSTRNTPTLTRYA